MTDTTCDQLNDAERQQHMLDEEVHAFRQINQNLLFELSQCAVYKTVEECVRDSCDARKFGSTAIGRTPQTDEELANATYELYESLYDNPQTIRGVGLYPLVAASDDQQRHSTQLYSLIDAVDIGCADAQNNREKKTRAELLDIVF